MEKVFNKKSLWILGLLLLASGILVFALSRYYMAAYSGKNNAALENNSGGFLKTAEDQENISQEGKFDKIPDILGSDGIEIKSAGEEESINIKSDGVAGSIKAKNDGPKEKLNSYSNQGSSLIIKKDGKEIVNKTWPEALDLSGNLQVEPNGNLEFHSKSWYEGGTNSANQENINLDLRSGSTRIETHTNINSKEESNIRIESNINAQVNQSSL